MVRIPPSRHLRIGLLFACISIWLVPVGISQNIGLVWSTPINVATPALHDNIRPQIALTTGGTPLVIWASTIGGPKGWAARWNGSAFSSPIQINPSGQINAYTAEGPNLAAKGDTAYIVYTTYPDNAAQTMLRSSFDGGLTWNSPAWVDSLDTDIPTFSHVTILPGGHPAVMYIRQTATYTNPRYVMRISQDHGLTWLPEAEASTVAPGGIVCDCCTGQPYAQDGRIVVTFRNNDGNVRDMWAAISSDGGLNFGTAIDLDSTDWQLQVCPSSGPVSVFQADTIYTAFMSRGGNGLSRIYLGASHLATGQLGYNWMLSDTASANIIQNYPAIAGQGDTLVVAWFENNGSNAEIALRYSFHGPAGLFDRPVQYVTGWASGVQRYPHMTWLDGKLHLVWQDDATGNVKYASATVGTLAGLGTPAGLFRIFPNPNNGRFCIVDLPVSDYAISIHDVMGRKVYGAEKLGVHRLELDLSEMQTGSYFVHLSQADQAPITARLVLQK